MPTDHQQQQQQQEQRRERERALIVDKATAGCVADAVNQHFQESLKHVEQKVRAISYVCSPNSGVGFLPAKTSFCQT